MPPRTRGCGSRTRVDLEMAATGSAFVTFHHTRLASVRFHDAATAQESSANSSALAAMGFESTPLSNAQDAHWVRVYSQGTAGPLFEQSWPHHALRAGCSMQMQLQHCDTHGRKSATFELNTCRALILPTHSAGWCSGRRKRASVPLAPFL